MHASFWAQRGLRRRAFLRVAGGTAASAALVLAGCQAKTPDPAPTTAYQFTPNETGLLNYFYLLQQLKVALYQQGLAANPTGLQTGELDVLTDLQDHHVVQLQTLYFALGNAPLLPQLTYVFTGLTLGTRPGLLAAAQTLEDLTLAALNYSLPLLGTADTLAYLLKIASAEARHATTVRDLLDPTALAAPDAVLDGNGLAAVATPTTVLAVIAPYFSPIIVDGSLLPVA